MLEEGREVVEEVAESFPEDILEGGIAGFGYRYCGIELAL